MPEGVVAKVEAMATEMDQPTTEDELIFEWTPSVPIDDVLMDINMHQPDEEMKNEAENQQNILTTNDEPGDHLEEYASDDLLSYDDEESDYEPDELEDEDSDDEDEENDEPTEAIKNESLDYSEDADTTGAVNGDKEIKVEDVPLDEEEQETYADAVNMFPLSDSEEELRSEHDNEIDDKEYIDESHEDHSDTSHDVNEAEGSTEGTNRIKQGTDETGGSAHAYNLRGGKPRSYDHRFSHTMDKATGTKSYDIQMLQHAVSKLTNREISSELQRTITGFMMIQMTATAGIKKHGERAVEAMFMEFCQLEDQAVFGGLKASELTAT